MEGQNNQFNNESYQGSPGQVQMAPVPKQPKAMMLFVVSIIIVVFSVISIVTSFTTGAATRFMVETYKNLGMDPALGEKVYSLIPVITIFSLAFAVINLLGGILGILFSKKPEKSPIIIIQGCIMVGLVFINVFVVSRAITSILEPFLESLGTASSSFNVGNIIGLITGLILPVLYIIAGVKLGKLKEVE